MRKRSPLAKRLAAAGYLPAEPPEKRAKKSGGLWHFFRVLGFPYFLTLLFHILTHSSVWGTIAVYLLVIALFNLPYARLKAGLMARYHAVRWRMHMHTDTIQALSRTLNEQGYVTKNMELVTQLWLLKRQTELHMHAVPAIILDGPPGVGKTEAAKQFCKLWGADLIKFQFTRGIGREALMFDMNIPAIVAAQTGKFDGTFNAHDALLPGILPRALAASKKGRIVLLLDELDKAKETTDAFLLQFLQDGSISDATLGEFKGLMSNLVVFITKNNERQLSEPLMRRCRRVYMGWHDAETEWRLVKRLVLANLHGQPIRGNLDGLCKTVVTYAGKVRKHEALLRKVPSTPELASAVADCLQVEKQYRGSIVFRWLVAYPEDVDQMKAYEKDLTPQAIGAMLSQF